MISDLLKTKHAMVDALAGLYPFLLQQKIRIALPSFITIAYFANC